MPIMWLLMLLVSMCRLVADNLLKYSSNDILCIELFLKSGFKKLRIVVLFKFNRTKRKVFFLIRSIALFYLNYFLKAIDKSFSRLISIYDFHYYKISAGLNTMMILETKKLGLLKRLIKLVENISLNYIFHLLDLHLRMRKLYGMDVL